MTQRTINILNDSDFGPSVLFVCVFLCVIWYAGEPDFGDGFLHWMTDGEITYVAPTAVAEPAEVVQPPAVVPVVVPVKAANPNPLNDRTDPFAEGAETNMDWLIKPVPATADGEDEEAS